ncbi:hypothetical protein [Candidatus Ferrigenium straubiae]|jgi:hypothetical protein|uniref:hypothetical protein n=1 Tax=Candidatus Ferrigenium straubiae TaxID=2919506 RepID=UPI003F4AA19E
MKHLFSLSILLLSLSAFADESSSGAVSAVVPIAEVGSASGMSEPPQYKVSKNIVGLFGSTFNPVFKEPGKKVFIEFVSPKMPRDSTDEKIKQAVIEVSNAVDMLSGEARKVLAKGGITVIEDKADADIAFEIVAAQLHYGHDHAHPIIVPYLGIAATTDWDDLQRKMKLQKPGARAGLDAGIFFGPAMALLSGVTRAVADQHSDDLVEDTSPVEQGMLLVVEMYIKKNGEFKREQRDWPRAQLEKPSTYIYAKPDQLFADAVECIISCTR